MRRNLRPSLDPPDLPIDHAAGPVDQTTGPVDHAAATGDRPDRRAAVMHGSLGSMVATRADTGVE